jgi:hypothetical protein
MGLCTYRLHRDRFCGLVVRVLGVGGMSMSICEKTTTLIFLDLELVHHFINGTATNATTALYCTRSCSSTVLVQLSNCNIWSWSCDRRSVGQSVLMSSFHLELMTKFFFSAWQFRVSWCWTSSLTRGWICNLLVQLLLGLARAATLGSKSRRTHGNILLSHLRLPQPKSKSHYDQQSVGQSV